MIYLPLRELMDRALRRFREDLDDASAIFALPEEWPAATVAEVEGRVENALSDAMIAALRAGASRGGPAIAASIHNGSVRVRIPASVAAETVSRLSARLAPIGGKVESSPGSVELWLPRA